MVEDENDNSPDDSNEDAVDIDATHPLSTEHIKEESADESAHDAENDVENHPFASLVDDLATNEPSNQTYDQPSYDGHCLLP